MPENPSSTLIAAFLIISLVAVVMSNILKKTFAKSAVTGMTAAYAYSAVVGISTAVVLLIWGGLGEVSAYTAILATVFGIVTSLQNSVNMLSMQIGPMSYTTVIMSFSTLISALSGLFFFGESVAVSQLIGIVLMLFSFVLAVDKKDGEKSASLRWLILCIICFFLTGGIGIMQKIHQSSDFRGELNGFLIIAFAVSSVISTILSVVTSKGGKKRIFPEGTDKKALVKAIVLMILPGLFVGANNKLNLYLTGKMDSAVFFPVFNGSMLVITTLAAVVIFRERLTKKQWLGIAVGILSVLFLCLKFGAVFTLSPDAASI